jgi:NAD(P)-dependent dehydrogenase (short-subunit alcohol dehydrogenase family)
MEFKDKIVLITGAASGIGHATAKLYGAEGATVVVSDVNESGGHETVRQITEGGGTAAFIKANVTEYEEVKTLITSIVRQFGRLDIAVNNAGIASQQYLKTADHTLEDWDRVIAVNQTGVFYCMKLELQQMRQQEGGCIINIASIAGLRGLPNNLAYVASKHAVVGMTKTAAMEYARYNIRINAVCPVFTITPLFQPESFGKEGLAEKLKRGIPMRRFAQPVEMANAILWLSSDKASFVTGHAMSVDGGLTA